MTDINLTANETAVLKNLRSFSYMDQGMETDMVWADTFAMDVQDACGVDAPSVGGIVASLCKKGFFSIVEEISEGDNGIIIHPVAWDYYRQLNPEA